MLYGILVHVTTLGLPEGLRWIPVTSGYFRMGLFFLVSGFFAAMMLRRYAAGIFCGGERLLFWSLWQRASFS